MRQRFDGVRSPVRQVVVLHDQREHQDDDAADVHDTRNDKRHQEQKIKEWTWHWPSFVPSARSNEWQRSCRVRPKDFPLKRCGKVAHGGTVGLPRGNFSARMRENSLLGLGCDAGENAGHDPVAARPVEAEDFQRR